MSQEIPPVAVLVGHRVAEYDTWKKAFDEFRPGRQEAGCLGHDVNRDADDPDMVYVYCPFTDADKLRAHLEGPDLAEVMKRAGVAGKPTITLLKPVSADFIPDQMLPGIIVHHRVEDYDRWRVAYDDFDGFRKQSGIVGHAVNRDLDDPNRVIVYHQARDLDSLRSFVASTELREVMQRAGVVQPVDIRFVQCIDIAEY